MNTTPLLLMTALLAGCARPTPPHASGDDATLPFDPAVFRGELDNGLRWYIRPNQQPEQRVELRLIVDVGSLVEREHERGLAHVVEHMAFNGTERFPGGSLVTALEGLGMSFGAHLNASTGFDSTQYQLTIPMDDPANLDLGLSVLAEWAGRVAFDPAEVDAERGVVQSEWRRWRGAGQRLSEQVLQVTRSERHAARVPIGDEAVLASYTTEDVRGFYDTWYRPELMSVIVVGDVDPGTTEQLLTTHLGALPASKRPVKLPSYPSMAPRDPRVTVLQDPETTSAAASLTWKLPHQWATTQASYREHLARGLFLAIANDRLAEAARQRETGILSGVAAVVALERDTAAVSVTVEARGDDVTEPLTAAIRTVYGLAVHGPGAQELERAKADQRRAVDTISAEHDRTPSAALADELARHVVLGESVPGIRLEQTLHHRLLPEITADEVRAAGAGLYDLARPYDLIVSLPDEAVQPEEAALHARVAEVRAAPPPPVADREAARFDVEKPAVGSIVASDRDDALGVETWTLSNGVRVLIKPTDFQNDQVLIAAYSPGGHSLASDDDYIPAYVADELAFRSGLAGLDAVALSESLAGRAVQIRPFISAEFEGFQGGFAPREADTALALAHAFLTTPGFDAAVQARMQANLAERIAQSVRSPDVAFGQAVSDALWQGHPRRREWRAPDLERFDLGKSEAFYRERFADLHDLTVFIVGNIDPDALREPVTQWLATLPAGERREAWRHTGDAGPAGPVVREVRQGIDPDRALVTVIWHGEFANDATAALHLGVAADVLAARLRERLREQLGATYDVSAGASTELVPVGRYRLAVELSCAPADVERLTGEIHAAVQRLREAPPTDAELATIQTRYRRGREQAERQNGWWLDTLASATMYPGRDRKDILRFGELVDALTPAAITETLSKTVAPERYVQVALLPEQAP